MEKHELTRDLTHRQLAHQSHDNVFAELLAELHSATGTSPESHTAFYESLASDYQTRFTVTLYPNDIAQRIAARRRRGD